MSDEQRVDRRVRRRLLALAEWALAKRAEMEATPPGLPVEVADDVLRTVEDCVAQVDDLLG